MQKKEFRPLSHTAHQKLKWIKDINERPESVKVLRRKQRKNLFDIGLGNNFWNIIPKYLQERQK